MTDQPFRKSETIARRNSRDFIGAGSAAGSCGPSLDFFPRSVVSAAFEQERGTRLRRLLHNHQGRKIVFEALFLPFQFNQSVARLL